MAVIEIEQDLDPRMLTLVQILESAFSQIVGETMVLLPVLLVRCVHGRAAEMAPLGIKQVSRS